MKRQSQLKHRFSRVLVNGLAVAVLFGLVSALKSQEAKTQSPDNKPPPQAGQQPSNAKDKLPPAPAAAKANESDKKQAKTPSKELSGAEIYSMHCARCHPERYPNERTSAQWKTIVLHMRVRANLPAEHVNKVLKYLQDNSGY